MTAMQLARMVRARRIGKGKWMARCPVHGEKTGSLSIRDLGDHIGVRCFGCGAGGRQVMKGLGLKPRELYYDSRMRPEVRERLTLEDQREALERQQGLAMWLEAVEPGKRRYWAAAQKRIAGELDLIRCRLEPAAVMAEYRKRVYQCMVREKGIDRMMEEIWEAGLGLPPLARG